MHHSPLTFQSLSLVSCSWPSPSISYTGMRYMPAFSLPPYFILYHHHDYYYYYFLLPFVLILLHLLPYFDAPVYPCSREPCGPPSLQISAFVPAALSIPSSFPASLPQILYDRKKGKKPNTHKHTLTKNSTFSFTLSHPYTPFIFIYLTLSSRSISLAS